MSAVAVIPARYASSRFPGKPLAQLGGKALLQWVWEAVSGSSLFREVLIATDSTLISAAAAGFGASAILTSPEHASGTDRVAEAIRDISCDLVVNIQGDEPFITKQALQSLLACFADDSARMASLQAKLTEAALLKDPNVVKVVCDARGNALYFSRSAIPFDRDGALPTEYFRHIGVYAFRRETLLEFVALPQGILERTEKLEQLRALEHGIPIRMVMTDYQGLGVDTPQDLARAEVLLQENRR